MPYCLRPQCPAIVSRGYCAAHRAMARPFGHRRAQGYTRRWDQRAAAFRKRYPLCGQRPGGQRPVMSECYDRGIVTVAAQVDHVVPHRGDQGLFWDEANNWQSLCRSCGARKTRKGL